MSRQDSVGMMNGAFFVGKRVILDWIKDFFGLKVDKIEHLGNGAVYLHIMDALYPNAVNLSKANFNAYLEHDNLRNLKYLQSVMKSVGINRDFDLNRIASQNYMANLEMAQWFKSLFDNNYNSDVPYDAPGRRGQKPTSSFPPRAERPNPSRRSMSNPSFTVANPAEDPPALGRKELHKLEKELDDMTTKVAKLEKERNFYLKKLLFIEQMTQDKDVVDVDELKTVLYATDLGSLKGKKEELLE
ncbi:hypothetical protein GEMRC1_001148 [Eukaryota sp. GEM-RC1]